MDSNFLKSIYRTHQDCMECPSSQSVEQFFVDLLGILFPNFASTPANSEIELKNRVDTLKKDMDRILYKNLLRETVSPQETIAMFFDELPRVYQLLQYDIDAIYEGDPAAKSRDEVVRAYPGFYAIAAYRIAHLLLHLRVSTVPRLITEHAHSKTGIDIHPGAQIGSHFFIDHGTGIVIGETTVIGDHVKIYQGVTLGALSVNKADVRIKRHPTIGDNVIIYSGATILGGNTVVGQNSIIGGNVWLTKSIPAGSKLYYQAASQTSINNKNHSFKDE